VEVIEWFWREVFTSKRIGGMTLPPWPLLASLDIIFLLGLPLPPVLLQVPGRCKNYS
jgi:hypothetical protein